MKRVYSINRKDINRKEEIVKKLFILFSALVLLAGFYGVSGAEITGSAHDFSGFNFSGGQICLPCHTPHNAQDDATPLWNHELSVATYNLYSSPTMDATVNQPTGASKLCLSCHDGTVAVDSFGGESGSMFIDAFSADANLTTDLSNDHPISFVYDDALATTDAGLWDPTTKVVTIGSGSFTRTGTISEVMLADNVLQCQGCHSVHNDFVAGTQLSNALLKISIGGSELCLACHNK
jgi:hypothetical protein